MFKFGVWLETRISPLPLSEFQGPGAKQRFPEYGIPLRTCALAPTLSFLKTFRTCKPASRKYASRARSRHTSFSLVRWFITNHDVLLVFIIWINLTSAFQLHCFVFSDLFFFGFFLFVSFFRCGQNIFGRTTLF